MHVGEAFMARDEAIRLAQEALRAALERNAAYYAKRPEFRPDPERPVPDAIRAEDAWIWIPFERGEGQRPLEVRVNGITKTAVVERLL